MQVILAAWKDEIRRTEVQVQPRQIVLVIPSPKSPEQKWTGGVAGRVPAL
jgi:hypothetical protein